MMHAEIRTALQTLNVPVTFHLYEGSDDTYITYVQYDESGQMMADDEEKSTNLYFQINVFSKSDYLSLVKDVKEKMKELGAIRRSETDLFADGYYQRSIRFRFTQYNE
ncbi:hypothetical protein LHV56_19195 [Peribacillus frigoritolerans]|uniref:hypothetical protein n=1 Tax=Peribacillus frigoritolerans TaxID=450367 RepID=UPI00207A1B54|nr:hypothetical protein [Peribacillus frigoritolerans]USK78958.1 hypothetical protein LHV56_19195 [Peribacillus frigoritolerans]